MDILHTASSLIGSVDEADRSVNIDAHEGEASTIGDGCVTERNHLPAITPADEETFRKYYPVYRPPYDLGNCFDRTNLAIIIRGWIERCEEGIERCHRLLHWQEITPTQFAERAGKNLADLREHRNALFRLNELGRN